MTGILDDDSRDDFRKGAVDDFADPTVLGECRSADLYGPLTASLALEKNDGWYVDWAQFSLAGGRDYTCFFDTWLDNDSSDKSITNIKNVTCTEGNKCNVRASFKCFFFLRCECYSNQYKDRF